jgi:hypothetical protein
MNADSAAARPGNPLKRVHPPPRIWYYAGNPDPDGFAMRYAVTSCLKSFPSPQRG